MDRHVEIEDGHERNQRHVEVAQGLAVAYLETQGYSRITCALSLVVTPPEDRAREDAILSVAHSQDLEAEPDVDANMRLLNLLMGNLESLSKVLGLRMDVIATDKPFGAQG